MSKYITNTTQVVVIASFVAKEGKIDALIEAVLPLLRAIPREPGCIRYEINHCVENPNKLTFVEKFINSEAIEAHMNNPVGAEVLEQVTSGLVESFTVETFNQIIL